MNDELLNGLKEYVTKNYRPENAWDDFSLGSTAQVMRLVIQGEASQKSSKSKARKAKPVVPGKSSRIKPVNDFVNDSTDDVSRTSKPSRSKKKERTLEDIVSHLDDTFQEKLFFFIDSKGLDDVEVYTAARMDRKLFSKIRSDVNYHPSKITIERFCFALQLNIDEAKDLMASAGYAFSKADLLDVMLCYFLEKKVYNLTEIDMACYEYSHGEVTLF